MLEGILIGGAGGAIAGLAIWLIQLSRERVTVKKDKNRVYNYLCNETKDYRGSGFVYDPATDQRCVSTKNIASHTNLTQDRVRYICSIHEEIIPNYEVLEERWCIRKFLEYSD